MLGKNFILVLGAVCLLAGLDWSSSVTEQSDAISRISSGEDVQALNLKAFKLDEVSFSREWRQKADEQRKKAAFVRMGRSIKEILRMLGGYTR